MLGFTKRGETLTIDPRVPAGWSEFSIAYRYGKSVYEIVVQDPAAVGQRGAAITVDGRPLENAAIPLADDERTHVVTVRPLGQVPTTATARVSVN